MTSVPAERLRAVGFDKGWFDESRGGFAGLEFAVGAHNGALRPERTVVDLHQVTASADGLAAPLDHFGVLLLLEGGQVGGDLCLLRLKIKRSTTC